MGRPTYRVGDTVAEPFGMEHVILWRDQVIADKLDGFGVDNGQMLALHHVFHQVLVDEASERPPLIPIEHDEEMVSLGDEIV